MKIQHKNECIELNSLRKSVIYQVVDNGFELHTRQIGEQINFKLLPWAASFFNEGETIGINFFGYEEYVITSKKVIVSNIVSFAFTAKLMY